MTNAPDTRGPHYPLAPRVDVVDDLHGVAVEDPYRWLESPDDPRSQDWVTQQHALMAEERATWSRFDAFAGRVQELLGAGTVSPPYWRGQRYFLSRRQPGQQFAVLYAVEADGTERVLIDPMALDPSGVTTLDAWQPSKEGDRLAYQLSVGGNEESLLYVMDVATGETIEGPIDRCRYSPIAWLPGGAAFYYVRRIAPDHLPESERNFHRRVYLHLVGSSPDEDVLVFGAGMTMTNYYGVEVSRDGRWLQVSAAEGTEPRNDLWVADLTSSPAEAPAFTLVQGDVDAQTSLTFLRDGRVLVATDLDAPRGRAAVTEPGRWTREHWQDLVPEDPESVLESVTILDGPELDEDLMLVVRTSHGVAHMSLHRASDGGWLRDVELPGAGTIGGPVEHIDGGPVTWFVFTDHTTVPTVYSYDARTGEVALHAQPPGTVDVPTVHSQQVTYTSTDGTEMRMFVLSPAATPDRPRPTILYGYGGFGIALNPGYSAAILAWVEAGGVWAVANIRGGGEEGEDWHRAGMLGRKQNVFDDFHAAAEFLIEEGWTTSQQLGIYGGSNGGLLVGAAMTQRPDLFNAVVCVAPLLDMIRYTTSELGPTWTVEYGDPEDPEQFGWLHAYSPYHRVVDGTDYPATMFAVFDNDTRTDPMHGRKMCAAVQAATSGSRPILLRTEGDVGHGARSLDKSIQETADTLSFFARWTGLDASDAAGAVTSDG
ncbi:MAG: prolyl oligopeptidase family serine peptidase [Actinomycetales bacterium]|nr:prolyl oligopeptidase family serine peptidase [Actinomycetales bacterium]